MTTTEKNIIKALSNIFRWEADSIDLIKVSKDTWTASSKGHTIRFESQFGTLLQNIQEV